MRAMYEVFILNNFEKYMYGRDLTEWMLYFGHVALRSSEWDESDYTAAAKTAIFISFKRSFEYLNIWCGAKSS